MLQDSLRVKITEDSTLPEAFKLRLNEKDPKLVKLRSGESKKDVDYGEGRGSRVWITGRVH